MPIATEERNIRFWDELAEIHSGDSSYELHRFDATSQKLKDVELSKLGDLSGKKVLHLQCHVGLDSFALAMLGAEVTAVDYSANAISTANKLREGTGLKIEFHCASVYDMSSLDLGTFDVVFTSYGILVWLSRLDLWAKSIADHLKPGGRFVIVDEHPVSRMFGNPNEDNTKFNNGYLHRYWNDGAPFVANYRYSYASEKVEVVNNRQDIWSHSVSEVINSLIGAGLSISAFDEYDMSFYRAFSDMRECDDGWWRFVDDEYCVPLMFSVLAVKRMKNE